MRSFFVLQAPLVRPHSALHACRAPSMPSPRNNIPHLRDLLGYPTSPPSSPLPIPTLATRDSYPGVPLSLQKADPSSHPAKRKATTDPPNASPKRIKHSPPTPEQTDDAPAPPVKRIVPFPEKPAVIEERNGEIEFRVVNNDGRRESTIILTGLKCIFQKQLPKMPKDYIARLVYDRTHLSIAIVKHPLEVVGCVATCCLPFV